MSKAPRYALSLPPLVQLTPMEQATLAASGRVWELELESRCIGYDLESSRWVAQLLATITENSALLAEDKKE